MDVAAIEILWVPSVYFYSFPMAEATYTERLKSGAVNLRSWPRLGRTEIFARPTNGCAPSVQPRPPGTQRTSQRSICSKGTNPERFRPSRVSGLPSTDATIGFTPGNRNRAANSPGLKAFVRRTAKSCRRVTSVCSGTFILAAAGLLDGLRATTHWQAAAFLQRKYPGIRVESDRIFVKEGAIWTSAGVTAGIDLSLALIEEHLGPEVAKAVARQLVVYYRRPGGQSQFSALLELESTSDRVQRALSFARTHLCEVMSVEQLAKAAGLSPRQLGRIFLAETGQTPAKAVERLRTEAAKARIEQSDESIEGIAHAVGFVDPERMRRAFVRTFGHPPQAL